jgi:hypothetical protein
MAQRSTQSCAPALGRPRCPSRLCKQRGRKRAEECTRERNVACGTTVKPPATEPTRPRRDLTCGCMWPCGSVIGCICGCLRLWGERSTSGRLTPPLGLAPKIGCYGWKRRLQTVTQAPNLVGGDPEGVSSRLRCICAWGGAPSPLAPRSRGHPLKKSTKSHRALCNRGRRTHLRVAALPAALRASICSFASCPLDAALSGAAAAAHC